MGILLRNFINNQLIAKFCFGYINFYSLHVSGSHAPIIRRINCIKTASVYVTLYKWPFGVQVWIRLQSDPNLHTKLSSIQSNIYRCRFNAINSPDDGRMAARNMYRIEINISEKEFCVKLVIYKDSFITC
jgi:hypothetical protein